MDPFPQLYAAKSWMNCSTNVPYWAVVLRVGCVLSHVIAATGDLPWSWALHLNIILQTTVCHDQRVLWSIVWSAILLDTGYRNVLCLIQAPSLCPASMRIFVRHGAYCILLQVRDTKMRMGKQRLLWNQLSICSNPLPYNIKIFSLVRIGQHTPSRRS